MKQWCDNHCFFGMNFELIHNTVVSSFELTVRIGNPQQGRLELWLIKGTPELGTGVPPVQWATTNKIITIFNSEIDGRRGGDCHSWFKFPLPNAIGLEAGVYTISQQLVDDDGMYITDCQAHSLSGFTWYQTSDTDLADYRTAISFHNNEWKGNQHAQRLLGLRVNEGSDCTGVFMSTDAV